MSAHNNWTTEITGFPRRAHHAAVAVGATIYSFGGYSNEANFSRYGPIDIYTLNTASSHHPMQWELLPFETNGDTPSQRWRHTAVAHGHFIYLWGGQNFIDYCRTLYRFDTINSKWEVPPVSGLGPEARSNHSAVVIRNKMYIHGGDTERAGLVPDSRTHVLDLNTLVWSSLHTIGKVPTPRRYHTATVYKDRYMLIFGGQIEIENELVSVCALELFDTQAKYWTHLNDHETNGTNRKPQCRNSHSAFMVKDFMYTFGGYGPWKFILWWTGETYLNDTFRFDPEGKNWTRVSIDGRRPSPRKSFACVVLQDRVFIFGGRDLKTCFDDTFVLQVGEL